MKDKLKLIKTPEKLKGQTNFWNSCPRLLQYLPESKCEMGTPQVDAKSNRILDEPKCPWWINSEEHNNCFWKYIKAKSSPEGVMPELVQSELADLFGWSNTKTHFILKQAVEELTEALIAHNAQELLSYSDDDSEFVQSESLSPEDESY